jgi:hypothetical protein
MSTDMTDGQLLSGILRTIACSPKRAPPCLSDRAHPAVFTCTAGAMFALASMQLTVANIVTTLPALGIGTLIGFGSTPR